MLHLKCIKKDCPNEKNWCYIVDGIHLKILPAQLKAWSMAINNDEATLDVAPENIVRALMSAKADTKNPLRNLGDKAAKNTYVKFPIAKRRVSSFLALSLSTLSLLQPLQHPFI